MGSLKQEISLSRTSAINVQVKNRTRASSVFVNRSITVPDCDVPALSIVMELGDRFARANKDLVQVEEANKCTDQKIFKKYPNHHEKNHYKLTAYGHGPGTYDVVSNESANQYSQVLGSEALEHEFPRWADPESQAAVFGLKFCFEGGSAARTGGWFKRRG
jgi:hypothetical protein